MVCNSTSKYTPRPRHSGAFVSFPTIRTAISVCKGGTRGIVEASAAPINPTNKYKVHPLPLGREAQARKRAASREEAQARKRAASREEAQARKRAASREDARVRVTRLRIIPTQTDLVSRQGDTRIPMTSGMSSSPTGRLAWELQR